MTTLGRVEILEKTLEKLRRDGWVPRPRGDHGELCLYNALGFVTGDDHSGRVRAAYLLAQLIGRDIVHIPLWNDDRERTFADVEALLTAAIQIARDEDAAAQQHAALNDEMVDLAQAAMRAFAE